MPGSLDGGRHLVSHRIAGPGLVGGNGRGEDDPLRLGRGATVFPGRPGVGGGTRQGRGAEREQQPGRRDQRRSERAPPEESELKHGTMSPWKSPAGAAQPPTGNCCIVSRTPRGGQVASAGPASPRRAPSE